MDDKVFETAFDFIAPDARFFSLHGLGEPLLHPKFLEYLSRIVELRVGVIISTNGILLYEGLANDIFNLLEKASPDTECFLSLHTQKSVENWRMCLDVLKSHPNIRFYGNLLEHNETEAVMWLKEVGYQIHYIMRIYVV